jgi:hypothetical protein
MTLVFKNMGAIRHTFGCINVFLARMPHMLALLMVALSAWRVAPVAMCKYFSSSRCRELFYFLEKGTRNSG